MIKKLRRKFILINMSLVTLVLLIVFSTICVTSYQRLVNDSQMSMRKALEDGKGAHTKFEIGPGPKRPDRPFPYQPIFCVLLDDDWNVLKLDSGDTKVSDEVLAQAVSQIREEGKMTGTLVPLQLRYQMVLTPGGRKIAFADTSGERRSMISLILTSLLIGIGGLVAFFAISLFLANWALRPVAKAWEQQRQFVADASHELKTPLTVILANIGILLSHKEDKIGEQVKWVEYTRTEATRMKKLVDNLLFLARSDASAVPLVKGECNLSDAVWNCLLPFESVTFEQGVTLESEVAPDVHIIGNEGQLKQLVIILLDNACKYAGEHGEIHCILHKPQDNKVMLTVTNTGDVIPAESLAHLFERFYRVDKARTRESGGYGLGLSIAQSIVKHHHGKISAQSSAEAGTTFSVILPLK